MPYPLISENLLFSANSLAFRSGDSSDMYIPTPRFLNMQSVTDISDFAVMIGLPL